MSVHAMSPSTELGLCSSGRQATGCMGTICRMTIPRPVVLDCPHSHAPGEGDIHYIGVRGKNMVRGEGDIHYIGVRGKNMVRVKAHRGERR